MLVDQHSPPTSVNHPYLAGTDAPFRQPLARAPVSVDSDRFSRRSNHHLPLQELQTMLRQKLLTDPTLCQTQAFRACAPFIFFLSAFVIGVTLPRHPRMRARAIELLEDPKNHMSELIYAFLVICVGVMAGLILLRSMVRVVVKLAILMCEINLNEHNSPMEREGDEEFELNQRNLIVGGLFT